jgi:predicted transcriptional regulator
MARVDVNRGAKRAREARAALGLPPDEPLRCLLDTVERDARLPVVVARLPGDVAGACWRDGDGAAVLWVNGAQAVVRQRFTLAHELGHVRCGHGGALEVDTFETLSGHTTSAVEVEANAFAAEFLLPRAGVERCIEGEPTLDEVVVIGAYYGVSAQVVVFRLRTLGLASEHRIDALLDEIDERHHLDAFDRLRMRPPADRLAALGGRLPYVSPALEGTALAAAIRDEHGVDAGLRRAARRLL